MRALVLAPLFLLLAVQRALGHSYVEAGAFLTLALALTVVHFIRVRRFKRYDQLKNFD